MPTLHIALQDGFENDTVEVRVDGQEVYRKEDVTTMTQISRADEFEVSLDGPATVDISVPTRNTSTSVAVPGGSEARYLAISLQDDALIHRFATDPFGYA